MVIGGGTGRVPSSPAVRRSRTAQVVVTAHSLPTDGAAGRRSVPHRHGAVKPQTREGINGTAGQVDGRSMRQAASPHGAFRRLRSRRSVWRLRDRSGSGAHAAGAAARRCCGKTLQGPGELCGQDHSVSLARRTLAFDGKAHHRRSGHGKAARNQTRPRSGAEPGRHRLLDRDGRRRIRPVLRWLSAAPACPGFAAGRMEGEAGRVRSAHQSTVRNGLPSFTERSEEALAGAGR